MKNWLIAILLLPSLSFAQPFGNEWVDYNKEYYKISVAEDGIFKITYDDLINVGFPIGTNEPSNPVIPGRIQLFHRGIEVAIYIEGQGDNQKVTVYFHRIGPKKLLVKFAGLEPA